MSARLWYRAIPVQLSELRLEYILQTTSGTEKEIDQQEQEKMLESKEGELEEDEVEVTQSESEVAEANPELLTTSDQIVAAAEQLMPLDFSWIHNGCKLIAKVGRQENPYAAICKSAPFFASNGCWMVKVKWEGWRNNGMNTIECSCCEQIDLTETAASRRRSSCRLVATAKVASRSKCQKSRGKHALPTTKPTGAADGKRSLPTKSTGAANGKQNRFLFPSEHDENEEEEDSSYPAKLATIVTPERVDEPFARGHIDDDFLDTDVYSIEYNVQQRCTKEARLELDDVLMSPCRASRAAVAKYLDENDIFYTSGYDEEDEVDEEDEYEDSRKPAAISSDMETSLSITGRASRAAVANYQDVSDIDTGGYDEDNEVDAEDEYEDSRKPAAISSDTETSLSITGRGKGAWAEHQYEKAKRSLCALPGMLEQEVVIALKTVGRPYGLQSAMQEIYRRRGWVEPGEFVPSVGMRVQKMFSGKNYLGKVTKDAELVDQENGAPGEEVMMWQVTFDDGEIDDMTLDELFRCRVDRPRILAPCRGRQFQMLEIFSGECFVHLTSRLAALFLL